MCGIAGYIGPATLDRARIDACLNLMRRRGPDAARAYEDSSGDRNVYLLHTRLSIIDLDHRADQPHCEDDRVLVFNGELYNYLELRQALAVRGERFRTTSDTEVLHRVIGVEGFDGLDECEGMWAFAHYDERAKILTLCRDRFGEKPLYLLDDGEGLYFGSEVKFLFALSGTRPEVNVEHLYRYLVNGYKALYKSASTFFEGVRELTPASVLELSPGGRRQWRYWNPLDVVDDSMSYDGAVAGARERLEQSVRLRLRADVPLAFCLSGGIDSNALVAIAKRRLGFDVHGFTIVNTDERYEERELVDAAVTELGVRHTPVPLDTTGFVDGLRTLVRQHDAPVYTITYYAHWLLQQRIAEHGYRISVSGTAADELFTGYYDHHLAYLAAMAASDPDRHASALDEWRNHVAPLVRNPYLSDPDLFVRDPGFRDHIFLNAEEFSTCLREPWFEPFREERYRDELLRNRMYNELFHESVPVILHEDDHNAMYFSIENRSPFLDRPLVEFTASIPTRHLIRDGYGKAVLRDAVRGIAPDAVIDNHRKVGFNAPIRGFLDLDNDAVRKELLDEGSPVFEHVRHDRIEALLEKDSHPNSESKFLFYFLNAKLFLEEFAS